MNMEEKEMTMEDIRKRITYRKEGDFWIPNIGLSQEEEEAPELRHYGMLRKNYLKENHLIDYEMMALNGTLFKHCREIDQAADRIKKTMLPKLAKEAGATEELKMSDQMEWVRRMEMCSLQVREVIMKELIYQ
ncbi:MAG: TnpV protein [Lachnospiraceae bacterium]